MGKVYSFEYTNSEGILCHITGVGVSRATVGITNETTVSKVIVVIMRSELVAATA
jgi:hypothetical protein